MILRKCEVNQSTVFSKEDIERWGEPEMTNYNFCSIDMIVEYIEKEILRKVFFDFCKGINTNKKVCKLKLEIKLNFSQEDNSVWMEFLFYDEKNIDWDDSSKKGNVNYSYSIHFYLGNHKSKIYKDVYNPDILKNGKEDTRFVYDFELEELEYIVITIDDLQKVYNQIFTSIPFSGTYPFELKKPSIINKCAKVINSKYRQHDVQYCSNPDCSKICKIEKIKKEKEEERKIKEQEKIREAEIKEINKYGKDSLYIMHNKTNDLYKIGRSKQPKKRLSAIISSSGCDVYLLKEFKFRGFLEKGFHKKMKSYRVKGEWFLMNEYLNELIELQDSDRLLPIVKNYM